MSEDKILIKGTPWGVRDPNRPQPRVIAPGGLSGLAPVEAPGDAEVLFDGTSLDAFCSVLDPGKPAPWKVADGYVEVVPGSGGIRTREDFGDCQIHVEWSAPTEITGDGQKRGNSGVFIHDLYEIQILDCFENETYADGTTAAVYMQHPPLVNACCRPGDWNIFEILWEAPRFCGEELVRPARVTVLHNGAVVQLHTEVHGPTRQWQPYYTPHGPGPIRLQDHGDPVRFRNIWIRRL